MPKLIVIAGPHKGEEFPLNGTRVLAGRDLNNGIYLPDGLVSRHHAEIVREGDEYHLRDLQSTNGSFVNDEPVTETVLHDGDIIRLADVVLRYEAGPVTARPAAPASLKIRPATSSAPLAELVAPLATRPILKIEPAPAKPVVLKNESAASPPPPPAREAPRPAVPAPAAESNRGSAPLSPPRPAAPVEEQEVVFLERPRRKLAPFVILLVVGVLALIAGYTLEANALRFWGLLFLAVGLLGLVHDWTPLPPKPKTP